MTSVGLFFIGAVLFVNGLSLLGRIDARGAAPINALVGLLLVGVAAWVVWPVRDLDVAANQDDVIGGAGFLLFAFTYLWVALNAWTGHSASGLGWYCCWAAAVSAFFAVVAFGRLDDAKLGLLWVLWALLFATFFALLGLRLESLQVPAGGLAVMESIVTTSVPGALLLLGEWSDLATAWVAGATAVTVVVLGLLVLRARAASAALARYQSS
jgi:hypothetical protein